MKTGTLILFHLPRSDKNIGMGQACKLYRTLYGYNNSSCYGKYHTNVKGLLDKIKGIRLFKSVILVKNEDAEEVVHLLDEYQAEVIMRKVILNENDAVLLGV